MSEVISNTSPMQYLHQLGLMHLLPALVSQVIVPPAVVAELAAGRALGIDLPDPTNVQWVVIRSPISAPALSLAAGLGPGEREVLALALESSDAIVILDDQLARQIAGTLGLRMIGTLGILLDAKKRGLISEVAPLLEQLQNLRFRIAPQTRAAVLKLAGE